MARRVYCDACGGFICIEPRNSDPATFDREARRPITLIYTPSELGAQPRRHDFCCLAHLLMFARQLPKMSTATDRITIDAAVGALVQLPVQEQPDELPAEED